MGLCNMLRNSIREVVKIMKNRKSQAFIDFMFTYGWAILVVLVAVGALAYFGFINPDKFLPQENCERIEEVHTYTCSELADAINKEMYNVPLKTRRRVCDGKLEPVYSRYWIESIKSKTIYLEQCIVK